MQEFEGKTAVITGGASGIGRALAQRFADARMNIVIGDIQKDALDRAVGQLEEMQVPVKGVICNTMLKTSVDELLQASTDAFGNVHVLCNNAGIASANSGNQPVWEIPDDDWSWTMGVNFYGVLYGLQAFVPHMLAHGETSHIVNTASLAALLPGGGPYGVSKHGVLSLSEGLAVDLHQRRADIGVSVLCPGFVDTQIFDAERNRPAELQTGTLSEAQQARLEEFGRAMLARGKAPSEIADAVHDAISAGCFYILPHPAWDDFVRGRIEQVIARGPVARTDLVEVGRRREAGEVF